jgi:hypothetical protein
MAGDSTEGQKKTTVKTVVIKKGKKGKEVKMKR